MGALVLVNTVDEQWKRGGIVNNKLKKTRNKSGIRYTKEIMTCDEVAEYLRVHVSSVRRWSRSGKITAFKVGGRGDWRYREQDVLSFLYDTSREGEGQGEVMVMCMD
jgi:excisionase family DNA binding protein